MIEEKVMSKVNCYFDTKQKARHRQRRYYTAHKKLSRARKSERGEYSHFYGFCGYFVERQRERATRKPIKDIYGNTIYIIKYEPYGKEIFMVKHCSISAGYCKQVAARKFRRNKKFDEDSYILKGSKYKIDYDIAWTIT